MAGQVHQGIQKKTHLKVTDVHLESHHLCLKHTSINLFAKLCCFDVRCSSSITENLATKAQLILLDSATANGLSRHLLWCSTEAIIDKTTIDVSLLSP